MFSIGCYVSILHLDSTLVILIWIAGLSFQTYVVTCTMMTIIIQIFGDFLCLESDFERLAFCIKTICTSKSPKWTGDSYKPKKYFGYNGKLIGKSIFIKKILEFLQKFKFQKQQSVATTEYSCLLHHDCLVNIIREN